MSTFYSYDDQYNLMTKKFNHLNNNLINDFSAIDYFQFEFNEIQLHNCWKLIYNIQQTEQENHHTLNQSCSASSTSSSLSCFIPQSTQIDRLENLLWRKWTKQKYQLPEISPETVNWSKDCDITWLYGPLAKTNFYFEEKDKHLLIQDDKTNKSQNKSIDIPHASNTRTESFSSLSSSSSTLDSASLDCEHILARSNSNDEAVVFIDNDLYSSQIPKSILKRKSSNCPIDFERFKKDLQFENDQKNTINKSVSFADMVQIRQFH